MFHDNTHGARPSKNGHICIFLSEGLQPSVNDT